jgi:hypothetical protein
MASLRFPSKTRNALVEKGDSGALYLTQLILGWFGATYLPETAVPTNQKILP